MGMRTVLAVDEMLAHAVRSRLPGEIVELGHMAMRDLGPRLVQELREAVLAKNSVLAIGGRRWDALGLLEQLSLPLETPVVLVAPEGKARKLFRKATKLQVDSIVSTDRTPMSAGLADLVANQCVEAWMSRKGPRRTPPPSGPSPSGADRAPRVLSFERPAG